MKRLNRRGVTLIEMAVAIGLLGVVAVGVQSVIVNLVKEGSQIKQRAKLQKIARSLLYQVSTGTKGLPGPVRGERFLDPAYKPFDDEALAERKCFDAEGGPSPAPATMADPAPVDCAYDIAYYRLQMFDEKFGPSSDIGKLPLYRLYVRIRYKENGASREFYLSQFVTPVLSQ